MFRLVKGLKSFRFIGHESNFDARVAYDISGEDQESIEQVNFQPFLDQNHFCIPVHLETANENVMDCLPKNIANYAEY